MWRTRAARNSKGRRRSKSFLSYSTKPASSTKRRVPRKPGCAWPLLPTPGERELPKPWRPWSAILSRPLPTIGSMESHASSSVQPRCWSAPTASCDASFAKRVALAAREGLRWLSTYRSSGSMLAGRSRRGGRPLTLCISTFSISTLSKGYATYLWPFFTDRPRRREKKRKRVITYYTYEVRFSLRKVAKISSHSLRLLLDSLTSRNAAILHNVGSEGIVYAVALYPYLS